MPGRYAVQERFLPWGGVEGQRRLTQSTVAVVGLGALGGTAALLLARAGVGRLRLIDPDTPALDNLHRQLLYDEADAAAGRPKVVAAARALSRGNSEIEIETIGVELREDNARDLLEGVDLVLDGLDAPAPRFAMNDACLALGTPWVHTGVVGARGQLLVVRPGVTPCLRCWLEPLERAEHAETAASHGIVGPAPACLASLQASEALKLLLGREEEVQRGLLLVELWPIRLHTIETPPRSSEECPACGGAGH
jgi:adenylyltransferase/sulfurtransferase